MKLIDPQPMETLPEEGEVFIDMMQLHRDGWRERYVTCRSVASILIDRDYPNIYDHLAWSYTATTNPNEEEPT